MLGNISYKRKIGKNTKLLFQMQGKNHKKWWFCLGVRIGESMLGNRFLKIVQKPQKKPTRKQRFSHFITKKVSVLLKNEQQYCFFWWKNGCSQRKFCIYRPGRALRVWKSNHAWFPELKNGIWVEKSMENHKNWHFPSKDQLYPGLYEKDEFQQITYQNDENLACFLVSCLVSENLKNGLYKRCDRSKVFFFFFNARLTRWIKKGGYLLKKRRNLKQKL